uniref:Uncharacterized protein n=1 Tax=Rhizophora mucronata TaxID=61149 RepID=A0A2P2PRW3_RHIMU
MKLDFALSIYLFICPSNYIPTVSQHFISSSCRSIHKKEFKKNLPYILVNVFIFSWNQKIYS